MTGAPPVPFNSPNAVLDAPGAIDADTHEAFVAAVFGPFSDPDVADAIEGKTVKFEVLRNGVRVAMLSGTIEAGVAAVSIPTSTTPGDEYRVIAKALGFTQESEPFTIVAGAPSQIASQLSKTGYVSDGTDQITITATIRDQYGNLVEDGTPVAWTLKDASSHFAGGGSQVVSYTTNGQATATVVAPELPGTQEVSIVAGEAEHTVSIPVTFTTASLSGPADLNLANSESGTVTLSTNAANGTPVFWTISNGDVRTVEGTVSNGSASIQVTAAGTWGRVGPCVVTATVGGRITYHQIQFYTSDAYYVELDRFVICGDVTQDGVETITYPSTAPLSFAPKVVPNWTVNVAYYAEATVTIHGVPGGIYFVDFADSTSFLIAEIVGTDAYGRVQLDGYGTAVVQLQSKGMFDGNPLTPEFADVPVRVRPADPNDPFVAQAPGPNDPVATAKYVEHGWWTRTWDACQSFFGGDPQTAPGVAANMAGGMLIVGDVGSLAKNGWRAVGGSDTPVNYTEAAFSGLGLATEFGALPGTAYITLGRTE